MIEYDCYLLLSNWTKKATHPEGESNLDLRGQKSAAIFFHQFTIS